MSAKANPQSSVASGVDSEPEDSPSLEARVAALGQQCLAFAAAARIQHFRYCPRSADAFYSCSLDQALTQLESECANLSARQSVCQSLAFELLAAFAGLAHRPPCRNRREQEAVAKIVHCSLLELR